MGHLLVVLSSLHSVTMADIDLVNRDPNNVNDHLKVTFEDIIAEPEGAHSIDCVWKGSYICFNCCKNCYYKCFTFWFGICIAMEWGIDFALIAVEHIWCATPLFKMCEIDCGCCKKMYGLCVHCCLDPCCEACGMLFHAFKKPS